MTARTLRRKLVDEGMSFRDLLDRVRQDNCKLYFMEDTRPLGEIALLLGYSDLSAFTRAHKNWTGFPPSKRWRRRRRIDTANAAPRRLIAAIYRGRHRQGKNGGRSKD